MAARPTRPLRLCERQDCEEPVLPAPADPLRVDENVRESRSMHRFPTEAVKTRPSRTPYYVGKES